VAEVEERRARWHCRRGMLELDLVLNRFMDRHYGSLNAAQRRAFDELLELQDHELWEVIAGLAPPPRPELEAVAGLLSRS
jgi:antitoxin CptB